MKSVNLLTRAADEAEITVVVCKCPEEIRSYQRTVELIQTNHLIEPDIQRRSDVGTSAKLQEFNMTRNVRWTINEAFLGNSPNWVSGRIKGFAEYRIPMERPDLAEISEGQYLQCSDVLTSNSLPTDSANDVCYVVKEVGTPDSEWTLCTESSYEWLYASLSVRTIVHEERGIVDNAIITKMTRTNESKVILDTQMEGVQVRIMHTNSPIWDGYLLVRIGAKDSDTVRDSKILTTILARLRTRLIMTNPELFGLFDKSSMNKYAYTSIVRLDYLSFDWINTGKKYLKIDPKVRKGPRIGIANGAVIAVTGMSNRTYSIIELVPNMGNRISLSFSTVKSKGTLFALWPTDMYISSDSTYDDFKALIRKYGCQRVQFPTLYDLKEISDLSFIDDNSRAVIIEGKGCLGTEVSIGNRSFEISKLNEVLQLSLRDLSSISTLMVQTYENEHLDMSIRVPMSLRLVIEYGSLAESPDLPTDSSSVCVFEVSDRTEDYFVNWYRELAKPIVASFIVLIERSLIDRFVRDSGIIDYRTFDISGSGRVLRPDDDKPSLALMISEGLVAQMRLLPYASL